jgi:hypothetical protein
MASKSRNDNYNGVRVTVHSTGSFDAVITRLYSEIGSPEQGLARLNEIKTVRDRETFIDRVKKATGTTSDQNVMDRFMIFQVRPSYIPLRQAGIDFSYRRNSTTAPGFPFSTWVGVASAKESSSETPSWPSRC